MTNEEAENDAYKSQYSRDDYKSILRDFDAAVCEATAVSQAIAFREVKPALGYSTHVFARICAHAQALICAAPLSRWTKRDYEFWEVSAIASHARSILEGYVLFGYLADAPDDTDIQRAYVQVMHLYDCLKRIKILPHILPPDQLDGMKKQSEEIKDRLVKIKYFDELDPKLKKSLLNGRFMMITPQQEVVASLGIIQADYDFFWNYLSQYTHVLSFSFYRMEPNGRGTGVENSFDRGALCMVLDFCTGVLTSATDKLVANFAEAQAVRQGLSSKFAPGPRSNLPKHYKRASRRERKR